MKRVSQPCGPASTRAMMRSTRLQEAAPSWNSLNRRSLPPAASARAVVAASRVATWRRSVLVAGQTEDEVHAVSAADVEHLGRAVVAVAADQNLHPGPVGADFTDQTAQMGGDLAALGSFGRAQHGGDEAPRAVEHHDGLEAVFVVMGVEQPQLLPAMHGVEGVVDVERDPLRDLREGLQ